MPSMPPTFRPAGQLTRQQANSEADQRRGSARQRGYDTAWDKAAKGHLAKHPLCVYCAMGAWGDAPRPTAAKLVDHLIPHRGDRTIFWNRSDWISSCGPCHTGPKQAAERSATRLADLANAVRAWLATPGGGSKV